MQKATITLALCAVLGAASGCAHDTPRERGTVTAVTNEEVADDAREQGKTRGSYTVVNDEQSLGHDPDRPDVPPVEKDESRATSGGTAADRDVVGTEP
jgi:hypothetical protein